LQNALIAKLKRGVFSGHEMEYWLEAEEDFKNQCLYGLQEVE
jgi:hypothetical protein